MQNKNFSTEQQILTYVSRIQQAGQLLLDEVTARCELQNGSSMHVEVDALQRPVSVSR
jgi:hypothetical protein